MQLSRRADYSIRAMIDIAATPANAVIPTHEIAARQEIPQVFLTKIVTRLMRAGLLRTHRGATGGVNLARPAQEINLREIIEAVEGPIALNRCTRQPSACKRDAFCPTLPVWHQIQRDMLKTLMDVRLSDLAGNGQQPPVG